MRTLPAGNYNLHLRLLDSKDRGKGQESVVPFFWKGQPEVFKSLKILNNFVWELLHVSGDKAIKEIQTFEIVNPYDRWVYFKTRAELGKDSELWLSIDSPSREEAVIIHSVDTDSSQERMRFLASGRHTIYIGGKGQPILNNLIVRSIPVLQYAFYEANPHIVPFGPYDWEFLSKGVLPNINVMISRGWSEPEHLHLKEWKQAGKKWITIEKVPKIREGGEAAIKEIYDFWAGKMGLSHPKMDGIIIDEFGGKNDLPYYLYSKAIERIYSNRQFDGKACIPYVWGNFLHKEYSSDFINTCLNGRGYIAWEEYLTEQPTLEGAKKFIRKRLLSNTKKWQETLPGSTQRMIIALGYLSHPTESLNIDPAVNFKVYMDMQIRFLATHPAYFGLGGLQEYNSGYADEETVRWAGQLFRHYAIEGETDPLTEDPYILSHLENPDFVEGEKGWDLQSADAGSIKTLIFKGYSWLQGRYPKTSRGDTFLWMKRSPKKPNVVSQEIKNLVPGRLYSVKAITADYQNLIHGKSIKAEAAVSIEIENAEVLHGSRKFFQFTYPSNYAHTLGKFNQSFPFWMTYHWRVFRGKGTTAKLTIKDWKENDQVSALERQELMLNFIEIQPYLD